MQTETLILIFGVLFGVLTPRAYCAKDPSDLSSIVDDENLQAQITTLAESHDEKELNERLAPFSNIEPEKRTNVVLQVVFNVSRREGIGSAAPYAILNVMGLSEKEFIGIIAPYASVDDVRVRSEIRDRLGGADRPCQGDPPNFSCYQSIIREKTNDVPQGLVKYMYEISPTEALKTMARVYGPSSLADELSAEAEKDKTKALESFSNRPEWWARLYVAETMKKNPQLRDPAILKKLEKDDNPLVKEKVADITSGK